MIAILFVVVFGAVASFADNANEFDKLPDHLLQDLPVPDWPDVVRLAQVDRRFRRLFKIPPFMHKLLYEGVADNDLDAAVRGMVEELRLQPQFRNQITMEVEIDLYDRVMEAETLDPAAKAEILRVLIDELGADLVVVMLATETEPLRHEPIRNLLLNHETEPPSTADISAGVFEIVTDVVSTHGGYLGLIQNRDDDFPDIERLRARLPAPFDRVATCGRTMASLLLERCSQQVSDPIVILALLRVGIRFNLRQFMGFASCSQVDVPQLIPLLRPGGHKSLFYTMMELAQYDRLAQAQAMLQLPLVQREIRAHPSRFLAELVTIPWLSSTDARALAFARYVAKLPFFRTLIDHLRQQNTSPVHIVRDATRPDLDSTWCQSVFEILRDLGPDFEAEWQRWRPNSPAEPYSIPTGNTSGIGDSISPTIILGLSVVMTLGFAILCYVAWKSRGFPESTFAVTTESSPEEDPIQASHG